ncbi:hypothetical protein D9619_012920 [Psilocybe cf. subviscida]|uniref:NACHT domain-containing protein n=1 Tax=Psilocybe cf. subviscida TaxID=2480587 RepID=A0A8H5F4S4_9AGAR|nr:hypothetical protein D9619_012920 [Psilocybe cf. subviscida]
MQPIEHYRIPTPPNNFQRRATMNRDFQTIFLTNDGARGQASTIRTVFTDHIQSSLSLDAEEFHPRKTGQTGHDKHQRHPYPSLRISQLEHTKQRSLHRLYLSSCLVFRSYPPSALASTATAHPTPIYSRAVEVEPGPYLAPRSNERHSEMGDKHRTDIFVARRRLRICAPGPLISAQPPSRTHVAPQNLQELPAHTDQAADDARRILRWLAVDEAQPTTTALNVARRGDCNAQMRWQYRCPNHRSLQEMNNSSSRVSRAKLKSALVVGLQLAEKGVDGLPIPGVKGCIGGILKIIEQEELREANIDTFNGLVDTITGFREVTVDRLSKERNIPEDLKSNVERLAKKLRDIPVRYEERVGQRSRMRRLKDFISASDHAKALNSLGEDLKNAIQEFQTASVVNIQIMEQKREEDRLMDKLQVEHKAFYNAHRERPIEVCEPDTRVSLLEDVAEWAEGTGPNHPGILWLSGRAGVGKSTVAKTLATRFNDAKILGGSFMFSKPNGVTDGSVVFTTLASQLAHHLPEFRDHLVAAIRAKEPSIKAEIPQQFQDLLAMPLSQLQLAPPITMIILDAFDECAPETLVLVLSLIVENVIRFPFLRIVITSRPENPIQEVMHRFMGRIHEVNIGTISASEDIALYLQRRLRKAYTRIMSSAKQSHAWPADKDLASLVSMANNLFIFAATAVRFIGDERAANPERRLEIILSGQHVGQKHPFSSLDITYQEILRNALPEGEDDVHERFQAVVGTIIFSRWPHSFNSLAEFLAPKYNVDDIRNSLKFLNSVLIVPEDDENKDLQAYHKSFADFITDPKRCTLTEAFLHPSIHHTRSCLRHFEMAESKFGPLSAGNLFRNGQTYESYRNAAKPILDAIEDTFIDWLHHLGALADQAKMGNKTDEVILAMSYRAEAFSASVSEHSNGLEWGSTSGDMFSVSGAWYLHTGKIDPFHPGSASVSSQRPFDHSLPPWVPFNNDDSFKFRNSLRRHRAALKLGTSLTVLRGPPHRFSTLLNHRPQSHQSMVCKKSPSLSTTVLANRVLKHGLTRHGVTHPSAADVLDIEPCELRSSIRSMICRMQINVGF